MLPQDVGCHSLQVSVRRGAALLGGEVEDRAGEGRARTEGAYGAATKAITAKKTMQGMGMGQPMQPVMQGQPVMAPQPFMVQVPPGVAPGGMMMVQSPISGQMMQVQVPYNVPPGGTFQVMG